MCSFYGHQTGKHTCTTEYITFATALKVGRNMRSLVAGACLFVSLLIKLQLPLICVSNSAI